MKLSDDLIRELRVTFAQEAREHIQAMNEQLLVLEQGSGSAPAAPLLAEFFRRAHSLKGAAHSVYLNAIGDVAHGLETLFSRLQDGSVTASPALFDLFYQVLDALKLLVEAVPSNQDAPVDVAELCSRLELAAANPPSRASSPPPAGKGNSLARRLKQGAPARPPAPVEHLPNLSPRSDLAIPDEAPPPAETQRAAPKPAAEAPRSPLADETVRLSTTKLDALMVEVSELQVARLAAEQRLMELRSVAEEVELLEKTDGRLRATRTRLYDLHRRSEADARRLAQLLAGLEDDVRRTRLLPIATVLDAFPRMVRDLARDLGKEATLSVTGGETEVDRSMLEQLKDPLTHLLRNCLDHGLELPEARLAAGKPRLGTLRLNAAQLGSRIQITVSDDGAGIDLQRVKASAIRKGLLTPEAAAGLSEREALWLIFRSGLSTNTIITDLSGRGVGLDVVRGNIERLNGLIEVESVPGRGTRFLFSLPLTVATTQCLLAQAGGRTFGLPIAYALRILSVGPGDFGHAEGREVIWLDGQPVTLNRLTDLLGLEPQPLASDTGNWPVIVLGTAERRAGVLVEAVWRLQEVIIKPLPPPLHRVRHMAGATILGTGEVVTILNAADLLWSASQGRGWSGAATTAAAVSRRPVVLVVDDSITTRTLEKSILEMAGYDVRVAADGLEAWAALQADPCDLIVSDVDMPRLNGIELTVKVRADERLKALPIVLVTSLDSPDDRQRGAWAGADAYITKGSFDQDLLLNTIRQLI